MENKIIKDNNNGNYISVWESAARELVKLQESQREFNSAVEDYWVNRPATEDERNRAEWEADSSEDK